MNLSTGGIRRQPLWLGGGSSTEWYVRVCVGGGGGGGGEMIMMFECSNNIPGACLPVVHMVIFLLMVGLWVSEASCTYKLFIYMYF